MTRRAIALTAVLTATVMDLLDGTVVNIVLPTIQRELDAGNSAAAWIASGYTLALGVLLTVGGRLGDLHGPRRLLLTGTTGFAVASLLCATAPTAGVLTAGRVAQGAMSALMVPQALAVIQLLYPADQRARALGLFAGVAGLATVSGPFVGALLTEADLLGLGWRAVFLLNLPLSALVVTAAHRALPTPPHRATAPRDGQLDATSVLLLTLTLLTLVFPLLHGSESGWPHWTWPTLATSAALLALFAVRENRRTRSGQPVLLDTRLFHHHGFTGAVLISALVYATVFGLFFALALYLQQGLNRGPLTAALTILPWALGIPLTATPATRWLVPRYGRRVLTLGLTLLATGLTTLAALLTTTPTGPTTWHLTPCLLLAGCGWASPWRPSSPSA